MISEKQKSMHEEESRRNWEGAAEVRIGGRVLGWYIGFSLLLLWQMVASH